MEKVKDYLSHMDRVIEYLSLDSYCWMLCPISIDDYYILGMTYLDYDELGKARETNILRLYLDTMIEELELLTSSAKIQVVDEIETLTLKRDLYPFYWDENEEAERKGIYPELASMSKSYPTLRRVNFRTRKRLDYIDAVDLVNFVAIDPEFSVEAEEAISLFHSALH